MSELPLINAIPRFKGNEDRIDKFTNGTAAETWQTSGGVTLPTLAKFLADKDAEIDGAVETVYEARDEAEAAAVAAANSAAQAASYVAGISTHAAFVAASLPLTIVNVRVAGYYTSGDAGAYTATRISAPGTPRRWHIQIADSSWWQVDKTGDFFAEKLGAKADYNPLDKSGIDNGPIINDALEYAKIVWLAGGFYKHTVTINLTPHTQLAAKAGGYSNPVLDATYFLDGKHAFLVPIGLARNYTVNSMITRLANAGGVVANPSSAESYTASSAGRLASYRMMDLTNANAVGATPATARAVSVAVKGSRGSCLSRVSIMTVGPTGAFELLSSDTNWGEQVDIGYLGENGFFARIEKSLIYGSFRDAAIALITDDVTGDSPDYYPETDRFVIDECFIQGHAGLAIRGPDIVKVQAVTTTTVTVEWFASHRFSSAGSINLDGVTYTYTGLTFDGGASTLTFTGLSADPVAAGVVVGSELVRTADARTFGTGGTSIHGSFIRSISHPSLKPSTDNSFTDFFAMSGRCIELGGLGVRGIHFSNTYIHGREDVSFFAQQASDIHFVNCYHEAKFLSAGTGSSVSRWIALSIAACAARGITEAVRETGDIYFTAWSQTEGGTDMRPRYRTSTSYGRFGSGAGVDDGLFEPSRSWNDSYPWAQDQSGGAFIQRMPLLRGTVHPYQMLSNGNSIRASCDSGGRWGFGFGMDTSVDYPYALNVHFGSATIINAKNGSGTQNTGYRAENTAGNAEMVVGSTGEGKLRSNNIDRVKWQANLFGPVADNNIDLGTAALAFRAAYIDHLLIKDGITAPATQAGFARIYVDAADGDLKVKFGDGVVKTIVVDV